MILKKIDGLLLKAMEKLAGTADAQLDIVVTAARSDDLSAIIQRVGGNISRTTGAGIHCRIPLSRIGELAESEKIASIRLARTHTIRS